MNQFNRDELKRGLTDFTRWKLVLFALLCAERISGTFWAFSKRELREKELNIFSKSFRWAWANLLEPQPSSEVTEKYEALRAAVHHSEQFGDPLAVQAQCSAIALMYAIQVDISSGLDAASWSALTVTEAIDNYVLFSAEACGYRITRDFDNVLLTRELQKQAEDVRLLHALEQLNESRLSSIRTRNRCFSVPIAV